MVQEKPEREDPCQRHSPFSDRPRCDRCLDHYALPLGNQDFRGGFITGNRSGRTRIPPFRELHPTHGNGKLLKYPSSARVYAPGGKKWKAGDIFTNPDLARTLRRLVEAEKIESAKGREAGLRAARDRFYKGDIAREMAQFSEQNGGLFRYEDFASYTAKLEEPISLSYRGYDVYKNPSANQGPAELFALNLLEGYNLKAMGHNSVDYIHTSVEVMKLAMADRDKYLGDMDFIRIPYEGLLSKVTPRNAAS